eukprot:1851286-Prymnesium_polylepis.1
MHNAAILPSLCAERERNAARMEALQEAGGVLSRVVHIWPTSHRSNGGQKNRCNSNRLLTNVADATELVMNDLYLPEGVKNVRSIATKTDRDIYMLHMWPLSRVRKGTRAPNARQRRRAEVSFPAAGANFGRRTPLVWELGPGWGSSIVAFLYSSSSYCTVSRDVLDVPRHAIDRGPPAGLVA